MELRPVITSERVAPSLILWPRSSGLSESTGAGRLARQHGYERGEMRPNWTGSGRWLRASLVATFVSALGGLAPTTVSPAQATALQATPRAPSASGPANLLRRRPYSITYSGDGSALLAGRSRIRAHLRWTTWTNRQARGWGADWHDNCTPDCARGSYHAYPAIVHLYRPRQVGGYRVFTRMTVTYTAKHPPYPAYQARSVTYVLRFSRLYGTSYFWRGPY